jgi:hypothetical protein
MGYFHFISHLSINPINMNFTFIRITFAKYVCNRCTKQPLAKCNCCFSTDVVVITLLMPIFFSVLATRFVDSLLQVMKNAFYFCNETSAQIGAIFNFQHLSQDGLPFAVRIRIILGTFLMNINDIN